MSDRSQIVAELMTRRIVAVIRLDDPETLEPVVEALKRGGVTTIEVTMTVPNAIEGLARIARDENVCAGVGSVLDAETAVRAVDAGARFVVSPVLRPDVIEAAHEAGAAALPGAWTATEILDAHELGADIVKVFPAEVGGPSYIKGVLAPMPFLKIMPTGGVDPTNVGQWLAAGAVAVGIGSSLVDRAAIESGRYEVLTEKARQACRSAAELAS